MQLLLRSRLCIKLWQCFRVNRNDAPAAVLNSIAAILLISSDLLFANAADLGY